MADEARVIVTDLDTSEQAIAAVRDSVAAGTTGAAPIDRIPYTPALASLANSGVYTKRIASTDRCIRVVDIPVKGGEILKVHCSRACVGVGDLRLCPDHDKQAFQPSQTPVAPGRVINSASIPLTKGESDELHKTSKSFSTGGQPELKPAPQTVTVAAGIAAMEPGRGDLTVSFSLDELAGGDLLEVVKARICGALDGLPCNTVREMKQIVALQEKISKLSKGGKRGRSTEVAG
jgi:hypothetical protein